MKVRVPKELTPGQQKLVAAGKQPEYLNQRMAEIFKTNGYPDEYFARMFEGGLK